MSDHQDANDANDPTKMPQATAQEWGLVVAKGLASLIPFVGGPAAEVLGAVIAPQIEKRKVEWLEGIARGLYELQQQSADVTPERLSQDPAFTTAFLHASQIALRTHQREKLRALRSAALNVAAGTAPDDDLQMLFFTLIDTLTPWQLRLLTFLNDPMGWMKRHGPPPPDGGAGTGLNLVAWAFPDLNIRESYHEKSLRQLASQGLLSENWDGQLLVSASRTTELGKQFLAFITSPIPELDNADASEEKEQGGQHNE
jgi:hypothetical protein